MPALYNSRSIRRRRNSRSEQGRKMARARWDRENARRDARAAAILAQWQEFEITVKHLPSGHVRDFSYSPDLGPIITAHVQTFHSPIP
jgi:hypothetical protein